MDRSRKVTALWNWLPSFRAVAETEHLPTASRQLHVSASALSRTIRLLEDEVGVPLFDRVGRNLHLNSEGRALLEASRNSMRLIDECLSVIGNQSFAGPVHISATNSITNIYLTAGLQSIRNQYEELVPHVYQNDVTEAHQKLLRGQLDLAIHEYPVESTDLEVVPIGESQNGVFCGQGHPLYGVKSIRVEEVVEHPFIAPMVKRGKPAEDGWPLGLYRKVGFRVSHMHLALGQTLKGYYLIVLPMDVARRYLERGELSQVPVDIIAPTPIFASRRKRLIEKDRVQVIIEAIKESLENQGRIAE